MVRYAHKLTLNVGSMKYNGMLQGAVYEHETKKWYLSQAIDAGKGDKEHTVIRRFSSSGRYEGYCKLPEWGHGAHIGIRRSSAGNTWIWVPYDTYNSAGETNKSQVSRIVYANGSTKDEKDKGVQIMGDKLGSGGFSLEDGWLFIRKGGSTERYSKVKESDFIDGGSVKVYDTLSCTKQGRAGPFQGCAARGDDLFILSGHTNHNFLLERYSWSKNKSVGRYSVTMTALRAALKGKVPTTSSVEGEGLIHINGKLWMGVRSGPQGSSRRFSMLEVTL